MKKYALLLVLLSLVASCQSRQLNDLDLPTANSRQSSSATLVDTPTDIEDTTAVEAGETIEAVEPVEATAMPEFYPDPSAAPPETAVNQVEADPTSEGATAEPAAVINGRYETTYFRGDESAPVTIIDYSDFL